MKSVLCAGQEKVNGICNWQRFVYIHWNAQQWIANLVNEKSHDHEPQIAMSKSI